MATITVMPDFGNGPWAWLTEDRATQGVGPCIADATCGMPGFGLSKELEEDFAEWVIDFERNCEREGFDWDDFHMRGMALAKRLRREVDSAYVVVYEKPMEDPDCERNERTVIPPED